MDSLEQAYYEAKFENAFLRSKGDSFQGFFENLMVRAYKADFMPCRPWGNRGDRKNDGFLKSERRLCQVYAPNEISELEARKKIKEDFDGAKVHWGTHFTKWSFVHNAERLPPHVHALILDLERKNAGIKLEPWGLEELRLIFRKLEKADMVSLFGYAPDTSTKVRLGFEELRSVLEAIGKQNVPSNKQIKDVPAGKIMANSLSSSIERLLKEGMVKSRLVDDFFNAWHEPRFGERIAVAFRTKYQSVRGNMTPNEIFNELQTWAGGGCRGTPEHELAVLTILAYYFERCDIFEEPKSSPQ